MMIAALHANGAFFKTPDGLEVRARIESDYEDKFKEIVRDIYDSRTEKEIDDAMMADPFIAAIDLSKSIVETEEQKRERRREQGVDA